MMYSLLCGYFFVLLISCGTNNIANNDTTAAMKDNHNEKTGIPITSPDSSIAWGNEANSLRIGALVNNSGQLDIYIQNVGASPVALWSHNWVSDQVTEYAYLGLFFISDSGKKYGMGFSEAEQMSAPVYDTLERGEFLHHTIDIEKWRTSKKNKLYPIPPGKYKVTAVYENRNKESELWSGRIESGVVEIKLK